MPGRLLALALGLLLTPVLPVGIESLFYLLNRAGITMPARATPAADEASLPHGFAIASAEPAKMVHDAVGVRHDPSAVDYPPGEEVFHTRARVKSAVPNYRGRSEIRRRSDGSPIYSVAVSTDALGRRLTVDPDPGRPRTAHLTTLGCSFTWGQGVNDDETFASQLAARLPDRRVSNLGISGAGPNDLLAREEELGMFGTLQEARGDAIYLFIGDHVQRAIGAMSNVGRWAERSAYMEETAPGRFHFAGTWRNEFPRRTRLFRLLADRETTRFFHADWPRIDRAAVERTVRMVSDLGRRYRERTDPHNGFTVVIFSSWGVDRAWLRGALDEERLPYLDYSDINWSRVTGVAANHELDGHPRPATYAALAEAVIEDLHLAGRGDGDRK